MKITQEQFNKARKMFKKQSLSDTQKKDILSHIYAQPVATAMPSPYFRGMFSKVLISTLAILVLLSGTTYASMNSLPGDVLYGAKVNIIEPIASVLKIDPVAKEKYNVLLLEKRVKELESLQENNLLDENSQRESASVTKKNVKKIEDLDEIDEDLKVSISNNISLYNSLIKSDLKIESALILKEEKKPGSNSDPIIQIVTPKIKKPAEGIKVTVAESLSTSTDIESATDTIENIVEEVEDEVLNEVLKKTEVIEDTESDESDTEKSAVKVKTPIKIDVDVEPITDLLGL